MALAASLSACVLANPAFDGASVGEAGTSGGTSTGATGAGTTTSASAGDASTATTTTTTGGTAGESEGTSTTETSGTTGGALACDAESAGLPWIKRFGGAGRQEVQNVAVNGAGVTVAGEFVGEVVLEQLSYPGFAAEDRDVFVARLDHSGAVVYMLILKGGGHDDVEGVVVDGGGNSYVTGFYTGSLTLGAETMEANAGEDGYVVKIGADAQVDWVTTLTGAGDNRLLEVARFGEHVAVVGHFVGEAKFGDFNLSGASEARAVVAALDIATGSVVWAEAAGSEAAAGSSRGRDLLAVGGDLIVIGDYSGAAIDLGVGKLPLIGPRDVFYAAYDASGAPLWVDAMSGSGTAYGREIAPRQGGMILGARYTGALGVAGYVADESFDLALVSVGADQSVTWSVNYAGDLSLEGLARARAGAHLWVADVDGESSIGGAAIVPDGRDFVLVEIAGGGVHDSTVQITGPLDQDVEDVVVAGTCAALCGSFNGDMIRGGETLLSAGDDYDGFVLLRGIGGP
jgi:hypothetical protein